LTEADGSLAAHVTVAALVGAELAQPLAEIAAHSPASVSPETDIPEVARLMTDYNLVTLPVVDGDGRPIGVVSVDDILELTLPEDWRRRYGLARE
jgi:Mg/Co/Ni transporter MgtE